MANWVDHFLRFLIPDEQELYVRGCEFSFERHSTVSQHTAEQFASAWSKYTKGDLFSKFSYPYVCIRFCFNETYMSIHEPDLGTLDCVHR